MKCNQCGKKSSKGFITGDGFACSDECAEIVGNRRKAFHDALESEPLSDMPDNLSTADFERWTLKMAVQLVRGMTEEQSKKMARNNPIMMMPEQMALEIKERILRYIHPAYVSSVDAKGHERMFHGGTYCFRQSVPKEVIIKAAQKAEILQPVE